MIKKLLHKTMLFVLLIMVIFTAPPAEGQVEYGVQKALTGPLYTPEAPSAIAYADINNDGKRDIIVASHNDRKVIWYQCLGNGFYKTPEIITSSAAGAIDIIAADLNGDQIQNIIVASDEANSIAYYRLNDEAFFFEKYFVAIRISDPVALAAADLDADGDIDIVAISAGDNTLQWYANDGAGNFENSKHIISESVTNPTDLKVIDIDGDGVLDILVASKDQSLFWMKNDGANNFVKQSGVLHDQQFAFRFALADLDNDSDLDIISNNVTWGDYRYSQGNISWFKNDGDGFFDEETLIMNNVLVGKIEALDFDGDTDIDLVVTQDELRNDNNEDKVFWFENDGQNNFGAAKTISNDLVDPVDLLAVDLDEDGDIDLLPLGLTDDFILWYENNGESRLNRVHPLGSATYYPTSVFAADLDNDADLDLISSSMGDHQIIWYRNIGDGNFDSPIRITDKAFGAQDVTAADLDNDGEMDILSASLIDNKIAWYQNLGGGSFGDQKIITTNAHYAKDVHAADLNNDGFLDVISASEQDNKIAWYQNFGDGSFSSELIISENALGAQAVAVADLNDDGLLDVFSASKVDNKLAWYQNLGQNQFTSENIISRHIEGANDVYTADFDLDGDLDIIAGNAYKRSLFWYKNLEGNFAPRTFSQVPEEGEILSIFVTDLNKDNLADVIALDRYRVSQCCRNNDDDFESDIILGINENKIATNPIFSTTNLEREGALEDYIYAADLNGDGYDDIITVSSWEHAIYWYPSIISEDNSGKQDAPPALPSSYELIQQNFPNPFSRSTTIAYRVPKGLHQVNLVIYDALGRRITTLVDKTMPAGEYEATFEAGVLPNGIYLYRIQLGDYTQSATMLLVK